jgi:hypothetical protein
MTDVNLRERLSSFHAGGRNRISDTERRRMKNIYEESE